MSFATLLLLVAAPVILLGFLKNAPLFRGLAGERRVSRLLRRQLDQGSYQVIDNLLLAANNDTTQIDHVVVSVHGIFVLETKTFRGWIFGSERDRFWTQQIFAFRTRFQNPLRRNPCLLGASLPSTVLVCGSVSREPAPGRRPGPAPPTPPPAS